MKKIEQEMIGAILSGMNNPATFWEKGNTRINTFATFLPEGGVDRLEIHVALHGNIIAILNYRERKNGTGWRMTLGSSDWNTRTTHSRVNAIIEGITGLSHRFTSKDSSPKIFTKIGYNEPWKMSS